MNLRTKSKYIGLIAVSLGIAISCSAVAFEGTEFDGRSNLVIGYLSPTPQEEMDEEGSGYESALAHLGWVVLDVIDCLDKSGVVAASGVVQATEVSIIIEDKAQSLKLTSVGGGETGLLFFKLNKEPLLVRATVGPSQLMITGLQEAGEYFDAVECKKEFRKITE